MLIINMPQVMPTCLTDDSDKSIANITDFGASDRKVILGGGG